MAAPDNEPVPTVPGSRGASRARARTPVLGGQDPRNPLHRDASSSRPATPGVQVPPPPVDSIPRPVRRADEPRHSGTGPLARPSSCGLEPCLTHVLFVVEAPRPVSARQSTPPLEAMQHVERPPNTLDTAVQPPQAKEEALVTSDFVMELRCGMDTCVKAFKSRQKCVQQLLVHWEKGHLHDGLRYMGGLPRGKREAVVVDVLRVTDLQALGVDLEACVLLLPLIVEVLGSKFELCVLVLALLSLSKTDNACAGS
jgi:hypothetical protein